MTTLLEAATKKDGGIKMKDYTIWAQHLLEEILLAPKQQRESIIKSHLEKVHQRGYRDAVENDWWREQDLHSSRQQEDYVCWTNLNSKKE